MDRRERRVESWVRDQGTSEDVVEGIQKCLLRECEGMGKAGEAM